MIDDLGLSATHEPVPLADALENLVAHLRRFVYLPRDVQYDAVALWCAHTHAINACEFSPILSITSAVWRSGKSRVLETIEHVVARSWKVIQPSKPVLFREVDERQPTLLLDEGDTTFSKAASKRGDSEPTRAILNAGNRRGTSIPRMIPKGRGFERQDFKIYCAKAIAGIGELPPTIVDRSITIVMERKRPGDRIERLRLREIEGLSRSIHDALAGALEVVHELTLRQSELPDELDDRAQDGWEPLLAIAAIAGHDWPARARAAAIDLSANRAAHADEEPALLLLADAREAFKQDDNLSSTDLRDRLCDIADSAWSTWRGDKSITTKGIASLVGKFGVRAHKGRTSNNYMRVDFEDAWSRYLADSSPTSSTSSTTSTELVGNRVSEYETGAHGTVEDAVEDPPHDPPHLATDPSPHESATATEGVEDVELVEDHHNQPTMLDFDAPLCEVCGRRERAVPTRPGRFVCTFPHTAYQSAPA